MTETKRIPAQGLPEPSSHTDSLAKREALALDEGEDLQRQADKSQHGRRETVRDLIAGCLHWGIIAAFVLAIIATLVIVAHMILPAEWRWLSVAEVATIKDTITSVIVGLVFGFLAQSKFL
ncbi:hypothetical protein PHACT_12715 [Pseudohongiella acticola]|uniref:Uncharacterized protein n=1 Tax=Pseudohongiella acticola TaxID=1524254 RepID=A0A1E8CGB6_9GAMM|nr:hypothetical protein [Pseudohongiella acticola]OFE11412.1 hypothetical protein PHACT_12715 [Pseudohongiella acticola]